MDQMRLYIEPIKKKWVYHFIVSSKTTVLEKPEWYLNQTLKWIYEHIDEVETKIKLKESQSKCSHVKHNFILCMVELVMKRLSKDMKQISKSIEADVQKEAVLIHTYNEVIQFTKVIRLLLGKCFIDLDEQHDLLSVFSNQELFERIVDVEWECAERSLREIIDSPQKWDPVIEGEFRDNYKIPRCVDRLLLLIRSLTERVECFQQRDCQYNLIELQCFLFNKFLTFLKKSSESSPTSKNILTGLLFFNDESTIDLTRILRILNGVNFLRLVLKERYFIPKEVIDGLDKTLSEKSVKLSKEYKELFNKLVERVVAISECVEGDIDKFHKFIEPKLASLVFEIVRDGTLRINQTRQTSRLLQGLDSAMR